MEMLKYMSELLSLFVLQFDCKAASKLGWRESTLCEAKNMW